MTAFFKFKQSKRKPFFRKRRNSSCDDPRVRELICQIEASQMAIASARNQFEQVLDPTLIDCYIYELNAAQLRYQFLLRSLKSMEQLNI